MRIGEYKPIGFSSLVAQTRGSARVDRIAAGLAGSEACGLTTTTVRPSVRDGAHLWFLRSLSFSYSSSSTCPRGTVARLALTRSASTQALEGVLGGSSMDVVVPKMGHSPSCWDTVSDDLCQIRTTACERTAHSRSLGAGEEGAHGL